MDAILFLAVLAVIIIAAILLIVFGILKLVRARRTGGGRAGGIVMIVVGSVLIPFTVALSAALWFVAASDVDRAPASVRPSVIVVPPVQAPAEQAP